MPLRTLLVIPFAFFTCTAIGLTSWIILHNSQLAVDDVSKQLRQEISDRIQHQIEEFLRIPVIINQTVIDAIQLGLVDIHDEVTLYRLFRQQLLLLEQASYVQVGTEQGDFVSYARTEDGNFYVDLSNAKTNHALIRYSVDAENRLSEKPIRNKPNYDPRIRPWYIPPVKAHQLAWSGIYSYFHEGVLAVTAGMPFYDKQGQLIGVAATDLGLSFINRFLQNLKIGQRGQAFIIERSGLFVATSTGEKLFSPIKMAEQLIRKMAAASEHTMIRGAMACLLQRFHDLNQINQFQHLDCDIDNSAHFVQILPFQNKAGIDWLIILAVPASDFMERIYVIQWLTLALCGAFLFLAIFFSWLAAHWLTRPILSQSCRQTISQWTMATRADKNQLYQ